MHISLHLYRQNSHSPFFPRYKIRLYILFLFSNRLFTQLCNYTYIIASVSAKFSYRYFPLDIKQDCIFFLFFFFESIIYLTLQLYIYRCICIDKILISLFSLRLYILFLFSNQLFTQLCNCALAYIGKIVV